VADDLDDPDGYDAAPDGIPESFSDPLRSQ
jgi:hypothetical protein